MQRVNLKNQHSPRNELGVQCWNRTNQRKRCRSRPTTEDLTARKLFSRILEGFEPSLGTPS